MNKYLSILFISIMCLILYGCENVKVTFDYNCPGVSDYSCSVLDNKINCTFTMPLCEDKEFIGWYDAPSNGNRVNLDKDFEENTILYAYWSEKKEEQKPEPEPEPIVEEIKYKVIFNANGGKGGQSKSFEIKYEETLPKISQTKPLRDGYIFKGWYDNSDYTRGIKYYDVNGDSVRLFDKKNDLILYAGWEKDTSYVEPEPKPEPVIETKYKITFNVNGGVGGQSSIVYIAYGKNMPSISTSAPTRTGYEFTGWYDNSDYTKGNKYYSADGTPVRNFNRKSDTTLYAGWKIRTYIITYNLNDGSGGQTGSLSVHYNSTLPTISKSRPTRSGFTFKGWYDNTDYTKGKQYYNENNVAVRNYDKTSNLTLYAGWSKVVVVQTYQVTFNINGGVGTTPGRVNAVLGSAMPSITNSIPTRSGYTFMGWYDNADYTKGTQYYTNKNASSRLYDKLNGITLYAGWNINKLSIKYNGNGGAWDDTHSATYTVDTNGNVIVRSTGKVFYQTVNYNASLPSTGLVDYNGTEFKWTKNGSGVSKGKEYFIKSGSNTIALDQSKAYSASELAEFAGCDLSKKSCTITVNVNWVPGEIVRAATYNIGYFGCGTSKQVRCKATVSQITEMFKKYKVDIVGIQEAVPADDVIKVGKNVGMNYYYKTQPANINMILSKYELSEKKTNKLVSCHENRSLDKAVVTINGIKISLYNTHYSYQSGCPAKQMEHAASIMKNDPNPIILTGDTNVGSIKYYETYLKPHGFEIAAYDGKAHGYCDSVFILPKGHIDVISAETVDVYGVYSDHNFVVATLSIH